MNAKLFSISLLTAGVLLASASPASASGYKFTDLGTLGGDYSSASAINDSGQVVGSAYFGGPGYHATLWNGTTRTDLGTLGGDWSEAIAINNADQVAGSSRISDSSAFHATIWNGTTPTDLGTLKGNSSFALAINDSGQVAGFFYASGDYYLYAHATIWDGTISTDLDTLGGSYSQADGINNAGQAVGWSNTLGDTHIHATLWNGTTPTDLNNFLSVSDVNAGWVLREANGINDNGWLVGAAWNIHTGARDAFLLTPCDTCPIYIHPDPININTGQVPDPVPEVPEPETYALFMAGLGLMGFIARRRKNGQA